MRWPWRPAPDPLGEGVWRRLHERCRRAVDRYHQVLEPVPDGPVRDGLELVGADLAALLEQVRARCARAQAEAPSASPEVPPASHRDLHGALSRLATAVAQASEAAAMARVAERSGDRPTALARVEAARRAATVARSHLP